MKSGPVLLAGLALASLAAAAERSFEVDAAASRLAFTLGGSLHDVHGTLPLASGQARVDTEDGTASGEVVIDTTGAETGNRRRDRKMHRQVLDTESHPEARFVLDHLDAGPLDDGEHDVTLRGRLRLLGRDHPLELPARVRVDGERLEVAFTVVLPYVAWGLTDPSNWLLEVAPEVTVDGTLIGTFR